MYSLEKAAANKATAVFRQDWSFLDLFDVPDNPVKNRSIVFVRDFDDAGPKKLSTSKFTSTKNIRSSACSEHPKSVRK
jgi:hypothetical protein